MIESALTKTMLLLENATSSGFSSILFSTIQLGTNFGADRQASTASSQIS